MYFSGKKKNNLALEGYKVHATLIIGIGHMPEGIASKIDVYITNKIS